MKMFKPDMPAMPTIELPSSTSSTTTAAKRMPTASDPSVLAASQRTRDRAMRRRGRLSTILTDQTQSISGSSGTKLGA